MEEAQEKLWPRANRKVNSERKDHGERHTKCTCWVWKPLLNFKAPEHHCLSKTQRTTLLQSLILKTQNIQNAFFPNV